MKKIILTPNPYRDKGFQTVRTAVQILKDSGMDPRVCLPFEVDKTFDLPRDIHFCKLDREIRDADMIICFGGDGTILHIAKRQPVMGYLYWVSISATWDSWQNWKARNWIS